MLNLYLVLIALFSAGAPPSKNLTDRILATRGNIALWDFAENKNGYISKGAVAALLRNDSLHMPQQAVEGSLSGKSVLLDGSTFLYLPYKETGQLNVKNNAVTVIAWIKWTGEQTGFVAGMWNEYEDGGKRQYGLFASLPYYNGRNQVCGHISQTGRPTPPFPFSIDYSASKQPIPPGTWTCIAFTYDGRYIKSYLNGKSQERTPELIDHTTGFEGFPDGITQSKNPYYFPDGIGDNGSDFTVGAVMVKSGMGNFFKGQIGGIAVFNRALSSRELKRLVK
jgi:hypothetical protein